MKKITFILALFVSIFSSTTMNAQVQTVQLEQTKGAFQTQELTLASGQYQFDISNNGVDHEVGFVLVPKGKYDATDHIKEAYVTAPVATGKTSTTNVVNLAAGEYEYFCPLNPTPKYSLTVSDKIKTVKLTQVPGMFKNESLTLEAGQYEFEIANEGVDHEVGFVLVPKGQYEATDHIKAAYVKAPVAKGKTSKTNIVNLEAGSYEYFCPLNPTEKYSLTVK
ncbi:MAG: cupredoxin domain-containing protein [Saprospiraceae bacterium]